MIVPGLPWPSLRVRLVLSYLAILVVALAAVNVFVLQVMLRSALAERERTLLGQARVVAGVSERYLLRGHPFLEYIARDYGRQIDARVLILDERGRALQDSFYETGVVGADLTVRPEVAEALDGREAVKMTRLSGVGRTLYVTVPIRSAGEVVGAVFLAKGLDDVRAALESLRRTLLAVSLGVLAASTALAWAVAAQVAGPVARLTAAVHRISGGNLRQEVPVSGRDELARLGAAFNEMAGRLDRLETGRRAFVADAAHELRTPLAAMKALIEPLGSGVVRDPAMVGEFLVDIEAEVNRLARLADDLLTLSRLEGGEPLCLEPVDVGGLLRRVAGRLQPLARAKRVSLDVSCPRECRVPADPEQLERAVYNLVQNAIRHSPAGEAVDLVGGLEDEDAVIRVRDRGEGISPEDLARVFDRFYRADPARARDTGGTGLGLAIAREVVRRHNGRLEVDSQPGQGATFTLRIPSQGATPTSHLPPPSGEGQWQDC